MTKKKLRQQIKRYITLLSALKKPPIKLIDDLDYFIGLIDSANKDELQELIAEWSQLKPSDKNSLLYIEGR
jgi:hypothetical protein